MKAAPFFVHFAFRSCSSFERNRSGSCPRAIAFLKRSVTEKQSSKECEGEWQLLHHLNLAGSS